jgi:molecular chaperone DnaK (HSP70)
MEEERRGRKAQSHELGSEEFDKQLKNHIYYMKFKEKHPNYYKKLKNPNKHLETVVEEEKINNIEIVKSLKSIISQLNRLILKC